MAIKGSIAKEGVANELLQYFGDRAFKYDKEIRVNCVENGEQVQIKIALTAAKVAVTPGGDAAVPGDISVTSTSAPQVAFDAPKPAVAQEPTQEEKKNIGDLLRALGL